MWMAKEAKVVGIPGSSFFQDGARGRHLIRFAYPKRMETLAEAARRLEGLRERVANRQTPYASP
jgi:aminotransferase